MGETERKLFLFACKLLGVQRCDMTAEQIVRDVARKNDLSLKETTIRGLITLLSVKTVNKKPSELLQWSSAWTKLGMAQDANGQEVDVHHPGAVCWSLHGALLKCGIGHKNPVYDAIDKMGKGKITLERFNFASHHEEIIELLKSVNL